MSGQAQHRRLAVTLYPEWAFAFAHLGKDYENRTWWDDKIRGQWIAIHGGSSVGGLPHGKRSPSPRHLQAIGEVRQMAEHAAGLVLDLSELNYSRVLAEGRGVVAVGKVRGPIEGEPRGWYIGSPSIGWLFDRVVRLPVPVPCRGAQGLWELPPDVLAAVREQIARAAREDRSRIP